MTTIHIAKISSKVTSLFIYPHSVHSVHFNDHFLSLHG